MSSPAQDAVLYDSGQTALGWKLVVAAGTGVSIVGAVAFLRWFERSDDLGFDSLPSLLLGLAVALVMALAALNSKVVRRVEIHGGTLILVRDPGHTEKWPLDELQHATTLSPVGGWSRDPAELLVLTVKDRRDRWYALPDDADTPGIAKDINNALRRSAER